jgi:hypothetical protein
MTWTRFMDMHSGGSEKEDFAKLYIEAPETEARAIFYNRFGHNPDRVTCTCCGSDYSLDEEPTLARASAYDRGCRWSNDAGDYVEEPDDSKYPRKYVPLDQFIERGEDINAGMYRQGPNGERIMPKAAFIFAKDIKPEERTATIPEQGYVWVD